MNEDFSDFIPGPNQVNQGPDFNIKVPQINYQAPHNSRQNLKNIQSYQPSIKNSDNLDADPRFISPDKKQLVFSQQPSVTLQKQVSILSNDNGNQYPYAKAHTRTENPRSRKQVDVPHPAEINRNSTHKSKELKQELDGFSRNSAVTPFLGYQQFYGDRERQPFQQSIDSKASKRSQLAEQLKKQKEQLPVYYDSHAGTRFSIASELV